MSVPYRPPTTPQRWVARIWMTDVVGERHSVWRPQRGRKEDCNTVVQFGLSRKQRLKTHSCELLQSDNVGVCLPIVSMMSTNSKAPRFSLNMMLRPLRLRIRFSFPRSRTELVEGRDVGQKTLPPSFASSPIT